MNYKKKNVVKWGNFVTVTFFVITFVAYSAKVEATYDWNDVSTGCECNEASVGTLTSADFGQDQTTQDYIWEAFKDDNPLVVDSDRIPTSYGYATKTFNCHSYVYRGGWSGWLSYPDNYWGTSSGCWKAVASGGTIFSSTGAYGHSCYIANKKGKCGEGPLCYNNDHVYVFLMPTQRYEKQ